uniref:Uncharacterized protein n=1 Tax=Setaria viridis TaxID=4556 RepID=A0A4U6UFF6_SETVI|nr:hypothetical protein SEVIR_5G191250v2 [Setaria viridis]
MNNKTRLSEIDIPHHHGSMNNKEGCMCEPYLLARLQERKLMILQSCNLMRPE